MAKLLSSEFKVSASSNRVALRLHGEPLVRQIEGELPSEGLVTGAVQVPRDGRPLIFLADHPTTGGYPVVGVVDQADLPRCAQLRPGDVVRFRRGR
jgi:allophanate hydrolase subunit 2